MVRFIITAKNGLTSTVHDDKTMVHFGKKEASNEFGNSETKRQAQG
jgi:hypothetical protein